MPWRFLVIPVLAVALAGAVACGDDDDDDTAGDDGGPSTTAPADATATDDGNGGGGATIDLSAADFSFSESVITAPAGSEVTVEYTNTGSVEHTFTVDALSVDEEVAPGDSATITFTMPDSEAEFYCRYHQSSMQGALQPGEARQQEDGGGATETAGGGSGGGLGY
jgi:plastocyanin